MEAEIRILSLTLLLKLMDANLLGADPPLSLSLLRSLFHSMDGIRQHLDMENSPIAPIMDVFNFKLVIMFRSMNGSVVAGQKEIRCHVCLMTQQHTMHGLVHVCISSSWAVGTFAGFLNFICCSL